MRALTTKNPAKKKNQPRIRIHNRQKRLRIPLRTLQQQAERIPERLAALWPAGLSRIEVILVDARESGRLHEQFLQDPAPTDVITFEHGELIICPEVAAAQRHLESLSLADELLTYIIHGCLHLCGMDDHNDAGFTAMRRRQTRIRRQITGRK